MEGKILKIIYIAAWMAAACVILPVVWEIVCNLWTWVSVVLFVVHAYFKPSKPRRVCQS